MDLLLEGGFKSRADSGLDSRLWTTTTGGNVESARSTDSNYPRSLCSYSTLPAGAAATTSSDTTSTWADLMDITYVEAPLSNGAGSDQRPASGSESSSRRYECNVCRKTFRSRQSLGGHKNLHRRKNNKDPSKGPNSSRKRARSCESPQGVESPILKGVRCREGTKWVAEIRPPKSLVKWWLGSFPSKEAAALAYDVALCYFKSDSDLNFPLHELSCRTLTPIPPDLSPKEFAIRLREMVRNSSEEIIADRRAQALASSGPTVSGDSSTTAGAQACPTIPDSFEYDEIDPLSWPLLEDSWETCPIPWVPCGLRAAGAHDWVSLAQHSTPHIEVVETSVTEMETYAAGCPASGTPLKFYNS